MWIAIYKTEYYPSIFEFDNESEAKEKYKDLAKQRILDEACDSEGEKVMLSKLKKSCGNNDKDIEWYI